jgi:hypothetical protein
MIDAKRPTTPSTEELIASLRSTVQRLDQSGNPTAVVFIKELLKERITELEQQTDETPAVGS